MFLSPSGKEQIQEERADKDYAWLTALSGLKESVVLAVTYTLDLASG